MSEQGPPITPDQFGFVRHEPGPVVPVDNLELPKAFQGLVTEPLPTQELETDQGNRLLTCSLIGFNPRLRGIADAIEEKGKQQYSADVQGHVMRILKGLADNHGRGVQTVTGTTPTIFYAGNSGVNNGRLIRVYVTKIGDARDLPIYAKIGASRTKEGEKQVYSALGIDGRITL